MSDATLYKVGIIEESTYGTTPSAAMQLVNVTEAPLARTRSAERPNILTGDRRRYPEQELQLDGTLTLAAPIQYGNMLLLQEAIMANDIESAATITATDISVVGSTGVIASAAGDMSPFDNGDLVYISGSLNGTNDGWKGPVTSAASGEITVPAGQVSDESAGESITISTIRLTDASTKKSFGMEWQDTGLTDKWRNGKGFQVGQATYSWTQGQFATESYTLIGQAPTKASATIGTGSATAAPTSAFMNAVTDWGTLYIAETATTHIVSSLTLTVTNVQNAVRGLGNLGPSNIILGPQDIELRVTVLYDDNSDALLANMEDHDTLSTWWDIVDAQGNRKAFFLPAAKASGEGPAPGQAGNLVDFELTLMGHDPAKDASSAYVSAGFGFQFGIFRKAA